MKDLRYQKIKKTEGQKKSIVSLIKKKKLVAAWKKAQEFFGVKVVSDLKPNFKKNRRQYLSDKWINQWDFLSEAVRAGLRSVFSLGIRKKDIPIFLEQISEKGLSIFYSGDKQSTTPGTEFGQTDVAKDEMKVFVARDKKIAQKAFWLDQDKNKIGINTRQRNRELAALYGYPKCCIKFFNETSYGFFDRFFVEKSFLNTKGKFYWELNNFLFRFPVAHFPCSFDCLASVALARKYLALAGKKFSVDFKFVKSTCQRPVLFFTENIFLCLEGKVIKNNELFYKSVLSSRDFYPWMKNPLDIFFLEAIQSLLERGDRLIMRSSQLKILKKEKELATIKKSRPTALMVFPFK